jgi:hypothetical protein
MYATASLDQLATDREFVATVHRLTAVLLPFSSRRRDVLPLLSYGPHQAGTILRLQVLLEATADPRDIADLCDAIARVEACRD